MFYAGEEGQNTQYAGIIKKKKFSYRNRPKVRYYLEPINHQTDIIRKVKPSLTKKYKIYCISYYACCFVKSKLCQSPRGKKTNEDIFSKEAITINKLFMIDTDFFASNLATEMNDFPFYQFNYYKPIWTDGYHVVRVYFDGEVFSKKIQSLILVKELDIPGPMLLDYECYEDKEYIIVTNYLGVSLDTYFNDFAEIDVRYTDQIIELFYNQMDDKYEIDLSLDKFTVLRDQLYYIGDIFRK